MKFNQTFTILFWIKKSKTNSKGLAPIWCRITIDGKRTEFSTGKQIPLSQWDSKVNNITCSAPEARAAKEYLAMIQVEIVKHYNLLLSTQNYVTAEAVKKSFQGIKDEVVTFLDLFKMYNLHLKERREINELSPNRLKKFLMLFERCKLFMKVKRKVTDIRLEDVKLNFIVEFEHYLRFVDKVSHNTAMKAAKDLKQVLKYGVMLEYLPSNPFDFFKCTTKKSMRQFLDKDELQVLGKKEFSIKRLEEVRDCYLFSCYTGYAYADTLELTPDNVVTGIDGEKWILRDRKKTKGAQNVPLLPVALEIINKYKSYPYCVSKGCLLPVSSNQRYNGYLKEIADLCGIEKKLTTHTARHTFATTVLLTNDVPIETVKELLGHTDIRTTQIYAKVVQKKVSNDMQLLKRKLLPDLKLESKKVQ